MCPSKYYFTLCVRAIIHQIKPEEKEALTNWLQQSPENREYFHELRRTWDQQQRPGKRFEADRDQEWLTFEKTHLQKPLFGDQKVFSNKMLSFFRSRLRPAFILISVIILFMIGLFFWRTGFRTSFYREIVTQNKQMIKMRLSDGTHIQLNSGSSIKFLKPFSDTLRQVTLSGEAFFMVSRDERPFVMITKQAKAVVHGTSFNIWSRNEQTRIIVKQGLVRFGSIHADSHYVDVCQGQMSKIIEAMPPLTPTTVNPDHLLGWLNGRLVFEETPLIEVVAELERYYDVSIRIEIENPESRILTAQFANQSVESVLSSICLALGISYRVDFDGYRLLNKAGSLSN